MKVWYSARWWGRTGFIWLANSSWRRNHWSGRLCGPIERSTMHWRWWIMSCSLAIHEIKRIICSASSWMTIGDNHQTLLINGWPFSILRNRDKEQPAKWAVWGVTVFYDPWKHWGVYELTRTWRSEKSSRLFWALLPTINCRRRCVDFAMEIKHSASRWNQMISINRYIHWLQASRKIYR